MTTTTTMQHETTTRDANSMLKPDAAVAAARLSLKRSETASVQFCPPTFVQVWRTARAQCAKETGRYAIEHVRLTIESETEARIDATDGRRGVSFTLPCIATADLVGSFVLLRTAAVDAFVQWRIETYGEAKFARQIDAAASVPFVLRPMIGTSGTLKSPDNAWHGLELSQGFGDDEATMRAPGVDGEFPNLQAVMPRHEDAFTFSYAETKKLRDALRDVAKRAREIAKTPPQPTAEELAAAPSPVARKKRPQDEPDPIIALILTREHGTAFCSFALPNNSHEECAALRARHSAPYVGTFNPSLLLDAFEAAARDFNATTTLYVATGKGSEHRAIILQHSARPQSVARHVIMPIRTR